MNRGKTEKAKSIKVKVNGEEVSLNPFVTQIMGNTIWAMISSLHLDEKPKKVEIVISA